MWPHSASKSWLKTSKAYHDYFIEDKYEAGIELAGTEVKSIRLGHVNLKDSFCIVKDGELFVRGMHISPYEKGQHLQQGPHAPAPPADAQAGDPAAVRQASSRTATRSFPLSVYFQGPRVKVGAGAGQGQKAL